MRGSKVQVAEVKWRWGWNDEGGRWVAKGGGGGVRRGCGEFFFALR